MLKVTSQDIQSAGGFLSALTKQCENYVRSVIQSKGRINFRYTNELSYLERIIVHTDPHIDEYVAELLFRACLPQTTDTSRLQFQELSIASKDNDLNCKNLFPISAVLGIGSIASGGANPLFLFDEHINREGKSRTAESCSQIVVNSFIPKMPQSIYTVLREINTIDSFGGAHSQHIGNIIKDIHEIRFAFDCNTKGYLDANWKRALIDSCITAIIYCLENNIDLFGKPEEKAEALKQSLMSYAQKSIHRNHEKFKIASDWISDTYFHQNKVFGSRKAVLRDRNDNEIKNKNGKSIPQLLILSRCCFACYNCWGKTITDIIFMHFWETIFQNEINFRIVEDEVKSYFDKKGERFNTPVGTFKRKILANDLWVVSFSPNNPDFIGATKDVLTNYIKENNKSNAILLLENPYYNTKALFKLKKTPEPVWQKVVKQILAKEDCWYQAAPYFILNGNRAHLYHARSRVDFDVLVKLIEKYV